MNQKPLILIIDDEESIRDGCRQTLEKSGYTVSTAEDGPSGIKMARERNPAIVFVDLKMRNVSGMEVIETLVSEIPDIVPIMITGFATILSAVEALQKGAYDYIPKPFSPDQLRTVARRAIDHRNLKIEARQLREEKKRMEKNFITFVSHELRSPLVVVRQYLESLKAIGVDRFDPGVTDIIERCSKRVEDSEELIEHWLDLSTIESGTFVQKKETIQLAQIAAKTVEDMMPVCAEKGISLSADVPDNLLDIVGDKECLVRTFTNIVGNATKYTPQDGKITISAANNGTCVVVTVSDTGAGIPHEKLPFIFEPFYRVRGKEERHRGCGLGLTICKKIIESHGGEITAVSQEGAGTSFIVKLPTPVLSAEPLQVPDTKTDKENFYEFDGKDTPDRCFVCKNAARNLMILRQIKSMMLVHICRDCIYENISDYMLDNTKPWRGPLNPPPKK